MKGTTQRVAEKNKRCSPSARCFIFRVKQGKQEMTMSEPGITYSTMDIRGKLLKSDTALFLPLVISSMPLLLFPPGAVHLS